MSDATRDKTLRVILVLVGVIFTVGVYPLMQVWPSGWAWTPAQYEYEQMILGVYAVLGIYLLIAAREPARHRSLIGFAAWSSVVHGLIMGAQAIVDPTERGHLLGDVPALVLVGVALLIFLPARAAGEARERAAEAA